MLSPLQTQVLKEMGITTWVMRDHAETPIADTAAVDISVNEVEKVEVGAFAVVLSNADLSANEQQLLNQILFCLQLNESPTWLSVAQYKAQSVSEETTLFVFDSALMEQNKVGINEQVIYSPSLADLIAQPQLKSAVWQWIKQYKAAQ